MWRRIADNAANAITIVAAIRPKYRDDPPVSSAHDPTDGLRTRPMRPNATAVPTPVARTAVGYTCAASAYIVVWTALIRPPVHASIASTATADCVPIGIAASTAAPATAPAAMTSIVSRDP